MPIPPTSLASSRTPDLLHLDAGVELMGEVLDQFTEIDAAVGGEVEDDLRAVEEIFRTHQFHDHAAVRNAVAAETKSFLLQVFMVVFQQEVVGRGLAQDCLDILRQLLVRSLFGERDYLGEGSAARGLYYDAVTSGKLQIAGVEMIMAPGGAEFYGNETCHGSYTVRFEVTPKG